MKYLIDTNIIIDHFKGKPRAVSFLQQAKQFGFAVSVISIGEVLEGLVAQPGELKRREELSEFLLAAKLLDVDMETVEMFAEVRNQLRSSGKLINNFDILIAATAKIHSLTLVTSDKEFERIEGLRLKFLA